MGNQDYDKMVFYGYGLLDGYQRMINSYQAALFPEYNHGRKEGERQRNNMNLTGRRLG